MAPEAMQIWLCTDSELGEDGHLVDQRIDYHTQNVTTTADLARHVLEQLGLQGEWKVKFHQPGYCKATVCLQTLNGSLPYAWHREGKMVVQLHLKPASRTTQQSSTTQHPQSYLDALFAMGSGGVSGTPSATAPTPANGKPEAAGAPKAAGKRSIREALHYSTTSYLRIGHCEGKRQQRGTAIRMDVIIVARVDTDDEEITFLEVDTWTINGVAIGYLEHGREVEDFSKLEWTRDPAFEGIIGLAKLREKLLELAKQYDPDVLPLPTTPSRAAWDATPPPQEDPDDQETIAALIVFRDKTGKNSKSEFEVNVQLDVEWEDDVEEVKRVAIKSGKLKSKLRKVGFEWDVELWVLPQDCPAVKTFSWMRNSAYGAGDWLDVVVSKKYRQELLIEVDVVVKRVDGVVVTKEKVKPAEPVAEDDEGDGVEDEGMGAETLEAEGLEEDGMEEDGLEKEGEEDEEKKGYTHKRIKLLDNKDKCPNQ